MGRYCQYSTHARALISFLASLGLVACGGDATEGTSPVVPDKSYTVYEGSETLTLGSRVQSCSFMGFSNLINVKGCFPALTEGTRLQTYSDIIDFIPQWGISYEVVVDYWRAEGLADAPDTVAVLREVISSAADPAYTRYQYNDMQVDFTFDDNGDFLGQPWDCGIDEGCDWISLASTVDLTFELQESGAMLLVEAEFAGQ